MRALNDCRIARLSVLLVLGAGVVGCGKEPETATAAKVAPPAAVAASVDPNVIQVSHPEQFPLAAATAVMVPDETTANGTLAPDVSRTVAVNALAGGRILEIHARLGDAVRKGQLLLKMHSPDLANAIDTLRQAEADQRLAQRQYDRNKFLFDQGAVVARKDLEASEDALTDAKANTDNALTQVKLLNGDPVKGLPFIEVRAPISGVIVEQNVTAGAAAKSLDAAPNLFTIADLSKLWLLCDVYENKLAQVKLGDFAQIRLTAFPDRLLRGRVGNIFSLLDPATRSVKVRIELDNPDGSLRPGMFATATFDSQSKVARVAIPSSAIFRLHDKDWVFLPEGKAFRRVEVQAGPPVGTGLLQVLSGVRAGDAVVTNALELSAAATAENPVAFEGDGK